LFKHGCKYLGREVASLINGIKKKMLHVFGISSVYKKTILNLKIQNTTFLVPEMAEIIFYPAS
jgi:hypothetical protein